MFHFLILFVLFLNTANSQVCNVPRTVAENKIYDVILNGNIDVIAFNIGTMIKSTAQDDRVKSLNTDIGILRGKIDALENMSVDEIMLSQLSPKSPNKRRPEEEIEKWNQKKIKVTI